jgi:hypothetical protein
MGEAGPVVVAAGGKKDLGFMLEAAERLGVDDAVAIVLERRPQVAFVFRHEPAPAAAAEGRLRRQGLFFNRFQLFPDIHCGAYILLVSQDYISCKNGKKNKNLELDSTVFDVEPFGHELSAERLKAEWLRRNELIEVKKSGKYCFNLYEFLSSR